MDITLWIVAAALAALFLFSGVLKLVRSKERLAASMDAVNDFSAPSIKVIGTLEVLAAVGLILPAAVDIAPVLVPLAAVGLVLLMVGATIVHLRRHELQPVAVTVALIALSGLVAWGRLGPESFTG
jgi:hypothetical protein